MNENEEWSAELKPENEIGHFVFERWESECMQRTVIDLIRHRKGAIGAINHAVG